MACEVSTKFGNLDSGIVDIVLELNKKGYTTNCSCEGHLREWTSKAWNYNYSPVWISFIDKEHMPPYAPKIMGYDTEMADPWKSRTNGYYLGEYQPIKSAPIQYGLWVGFTFYKKQIKRDIHVEHERILKKIYEWAKSLPNRED